MAHRMVIADSSQFHAELQKRLDKMKEDIIYELSSSISRKPDQIYLTRKEVSQKYRISLVTLHELTKRGGLNSMKVGKRRVYEAVQVERFFRQAK